MPEQIEIMNNPQSEAIAWLAEMDLVANPSMLNSIVLNLLAGIRWVADAELVLDTVDKKMLVYIKPYRIINYVPKFGRVWFFRQIANNAMEILNSIVPTWKKRVIFDRKILEKALHLIKQKTV